MQINNLNSLYQQNMTNQSNTIDREIASHQPKPDLSLNARFVALEFQSTEIAGSNAGIQSTLFDMVNNNKDMLDFLNGIEREGQLSLKDLGYEGKPILDLSTDEATALISDNGFFSAQNTSDREADFVISGSGGDIEMLKAGREGMIKGFQDAEKIWGGKLPDIAYETQKLTLEKIDKTIQELGGNVLNIAA
jgi:hypothetical protein